MTSLLDPSRGAAKRGSVLVIDPDRAAWEPLASALSRCGFLVRCEPDADVGLELTSSGTVDVVLAELPPSSSAANFELCRDRHVPVVVVTVYGDLRTAHASVRAGAYDFMEKPFEVEALALALDRAVAYRGLLREVRRLTDVASVAPRAGPILGECRGIRAARAVIDCVAASNANVLVTGESGTGKALAARLLHARSAGREVRPFLTLNCSAIPPTSIERELFTLFARAHDGTVCLEAIGALPAALQPTVLGAIEEHRLTRVVATTHIDLESAVGNGQFRADLLGRIRGIDLTLPPLRARGMDVLLLAHHFVRATAETWRTEPKRLSAGAAAKLLAYDWPGNVRELRNAIERAAALAHGQEIGHQDLPQRVREGPSTRAATDDPHLGTLEEVERRHIAHVLESVGGNRTVAARVLGVDRSTLFRKLERWAVVAGEEN